MTVDLVINRGKEIVSVPDVAGQPVTTAAIVLEEKGLKLGQTTERFSEEVLPGCGVRGGRRCGLSGGLDVLGQLGVGGPQLF